MPLAVRVSAALPAIPAHIAPGLKIALGLVAALAIIAAVRLVGLWLIRKGSSIEAGSHGPLPGGYMDPTRRRRSEPEPAEPEPAEPEPYDPFNAG